MASPIMSDEEIVSVGANPQCLHETSDATDANGTTVSEGLNSADVCYEIFCEHCGISCSSLDDHAAHMKDEHDIHEMDKDIIYLTEDLDIVFPTCVTCDATFVDETVLAQHRKGCKEKPALNSNDNKPSNVLITPSLTKRPGTQSIVSSKVSTKSTNVVTFKCQFCESSFSSHDVLEDHVDEGHDFSAACRYSCTMCKKTYETKTSLFRHMNKAHPIDGSDQTAAVKPKKPRTFIPDVLYKCPFCEKQITFAWFKSLKVHIRNFHSEYSGEMNQKLFEVKASDLEIQDSENAEFINIEDAINISGTIEAPTYTPVYGNGAHVYKCTKCDLLSYYKFTVTKHLINKHAVDAAEAKQLVLKVDKSTVDIGTIKSLDKNITKQRLKQFRYNYVCPKCDFASYLLSNFKSHLYSQKHQHDFSKNELDQMDFHSLSVRVKSEYQSPSGHHLKQVRYRYVCPECDFTTDRLSNIKSHLHSQKHTHDFTEKELDQIDFHSLRVQIDGASQNNKYFKCTQCWFISRNRKDIDDHTRQEHEIDENVDDQCQLVELNEAGSVIQDSNVTHPFYKCPFCGLCVSDGIEKHVVDEHTWSTDVNAENTSYTRVEMVVKYIADIEITEIDKDTTIHPIDMDTDNGNEQQTTVFEGFSNQSEVTKSLRQLTCPLCKTVFGSCHEFMTHCSGHTNVQVYFQCEHCPSNFVRFSALRRHHDKYHDDVPFSTPKIDLIRAKIVKEKEESAIKSCGYMKCPYCAQSLGSVNSLMRHIVRQHIEKLRPSFTVHLNDETDTDSEMDKSGDMKRCVVCPNKFKTCVELTQHLLIHKEVITFGCDICDLAFNSLIQLVKHMLIHRESDSSIATQKPAEHTAMQTTKSSESHIETDIGTEASQVTFMINEKDNIGNKLSLTSDKIESSAQEKSPIASKSRIKIVTPIFANKVKQNMKSSPKGSHEVASSKVVGIKSEKDVAGNQIDIQEETDIVVHSNVCPHCNLSFRRASALAFHVNFSHTNKKSTNKSPSKAIKYIKSNACKIDIANKQTDDSNTVKGSIVQKERGVKSKKKTEDLSVTVVTPSTGSKRKKSSDTVAGNSNKKQKTDMTLKTITGKECKIETADVNESSPPDDVKNSTAHGNQCPHCDFSCKRSSALAFHVNFNHAKLSKDLKQKVKHDARTDTAMRRTDTAMRSDSNFQPDEEVSPVKQERESHRKSNNSKHETDMSDRDEGKPSKAMVSGKRPSIKVIKDGHVVANLHVKVVKKTSQQVSTAIDSDKKSQSTPDINDSLESDDSADVDSELESTEDFGEDNDSLMLDSVEEADIDSRSPSISTDDEAGDGVKSDVEMAAESGKSDKTCYCFTCNVKYASHNALWRHNKIKHNIEKNHTCDQCDRVFTFKNQLDEHMTSHMEKIIMCQYSDCNSRFSCEKYRIKHMMKIHGHVPQKKEKNHEKKVYHCDQCDIEYSSHSALWRHNVKKHSQRVSNQVCPVCLQAFMWPKELRDHMVVHETEKTFTCKVDGCTHRFRRRMDRIHHMRRIHHQDDGVKTFKCTICKKVFKLYTSLQDHLASHRTKGGQSICDLCGEIFQNSAMLRDHLKADHGTDLDMTNDSENILDTHVDIDTTQTVMPSGNLCHVEDSNGEPDSQEPGTDADLTQQTSDGKLHCETCGKLYHTATALGNHRRKRHGDGDRPNKCDQCVKSYWHPYELRDHRIAVHSTETPFMCDECGKGFPTNKGFQMHMKRHRAKAEDDAGIAKPSVVCNICGLNISSRSGRQALYKHIQRSHPETVCCNCGICTSYYDENNTELLEKVKAVCHICNQCFCQKRYLDSHMNTVHYRSGKHECKFCTASFATTKMLSKHVHKDHKIDPSSFKSTLVGDSGEKDDVTAVRHTLKFDEVETDSNMHIIQIGHDSMPQYLPKLSDGSLSAVIKELRVQNDDVETSASLPVKCLLCGRCFAKVKYLNLHIRRNHIKNEDQPYRCKICGSGFVRLVEFRKHSRSHSNFRPYKCRFCKKAFKQQSNLNEHEITHSYTRSEKCLLCKKTFKQRGALTSHLLKHSKLRPFKCPFCEKTYPDRGQLSRHMKQYLSIKDKWVHMCHICSETFTHFPLLMTHLTTHNPDKPFKCELCPEAFGSYIQIYFHKSKKDHFTPEDFEGVHQVEELENTEVILTSGELQNIDFPSEGGNDYQSIKSNEVAENKSDTLALDQSELSILNSNSEVVIETVGFERDGTVFTVPDTHTSDEILSIAKQLTELSGYTKLPAKHTTQPRKKGKEQVKIDDEEEEILLNMLDVDEDKLVSLEKLTQSVSQRKWEQGEEKRRDSHLKAQYQAGVLHTQPMDYDGPPIVEADTVCYENGLEEMDTEVVTEATHLYSEPQYQQAVTQTVGSFDGSEGVHVSDIQSNVTPDQIQVSIADLQGNTAAHDHSEVPEASSGENAEVTDTSVQIAISESQQNILIEVPGNIATSEHGYWGLSEFGNAVTSGEDGAPVVYVYVDSADTNHPEHGSVVQVINGLEYMQIPGASEELVEAVSQIESDPSSSQISQIELGTSDTLGPSVKMETAVNDGEYTIVQGIDSQDAEIGTYETGIQTEDVPTEGNIQPVSLVASVEPSSNVQYLSITEIDNSGQQTSLPAQILLKQSLPETSAMSATMMTVDTPASPDELIVPDVGVVSFTDTVVTSIDTNSELSKTLLGTASAIPKIELVKQFEEWSEVNSSVNFIEINVKDAEAINGYFSCPICEVRTKSRKNLRKHLQRHQGPSHKHFVCDYPECERRFFQQTELRRHLYTHNNVRPYKCDVCGKQFRQTGHLQTHTKLHTGERPFVCPTPNCNKAFITGTQLKIHCMGAHVAENHFVCTLCGKSFKDRHRFAVHVGHKHSGTLASEEKKKQPTSEKTTKSKGRLYICELCGIEVTSKGSLDNHMSSHVESKPFICETCGEAYRTLRLLKNHIAVKHRPKDAVKKRVWKKPNNTFKCQGCKKVFRGKGGYAYHIGSNEKCRSKLVLPPVELPDIRFAI